MKHIVLGQVGEKRAAEYLKKKGYTIIEQNYKNKIGEIDIIAKDQEYIVFVEVKTRTTKVYGLGLEAVTFAKQQKIKKVAQVYLLQHHLYESNVRFDVVSVDYDGIEHIINAFS